MKGESTEPYGGINLKYLTKRYWKQMIPTWLLVLIEGGLMLLFPLMIGNAVDGLRLDSLQGVIQLGGLCLSMLLVGSGRRFYDTRTYASIYCKISTVLIQRETDKQIPVSTTNARVNLLTEFIEFLENSIPEIINNFLGVGGTIIIILFIDFRLFVACIASVIGISILYMFSNKKIYRYNQQQNDQLEQQVTVISSRNAPATHQHFKRLARWNIKLSDLETVNFSMIWIMLATVLIYSVITTVDFDKNSYGQIMAAIMYVFTFIESVMMFPLYYQQLIRLKEIGSRLKTDGTA